MEQEIRDINIKDLVLWTENPRDPIDENAKDQDIVDRAISDKFSKWTLSKLAKEMGSYYDFSELPTVVYHNKRPVVYDGNRRMILGKIKHNLVNVTGSSNIKIPDIPEVIPCNVCEKQIALQNVYRKHSDSGSWQPLERDVFLHKFMGEEKSSFLVLEAETGLISANPHLNQRFVKEEIFNKDSLETMGFYINKGRLQSKHEDFVAREILLDIAQKIDQKIITTRKNRGNILEVLTPFSKQSIEQNKNNKIESLKIKIVSCEIDQKKQRQARRTFKKGEKLFGGKLYLRYSKANDLYRDITDLYQLYDNNKNELSQYFPSIIRMSLRLLCETAAEEKSQKLGAYLKSHFVNAKKGLTKNEKTTLKSHNVNEKSIEQLLHIGAHSYAASSNLKQTIAISIIIGEILMISHGQEQTV